jgi:hypothetical protein
VIRAFARAGRSADRDTLVVAGRRVRITPSMLIGSGGEAEIFDVGGGIALKRFKAASHADYAHSPVAQAAAAARLDEHQRKLPALTQLPLPHRVARPLELARDGDGAVAGYTMPLLANAEVLLRYSDVRFRENGGITNARVTAILRDLHATVKELHAWDLVIGDFNDLNVLVHGTSAHLIDIDSAQFGPYVSTLYTARLLDPRLTDGNELEPRRPHDVESDWYAFAAMAFRLLFLTDPYGGIYVTGGVRLSSDQRALQRISVFRPGVRLPKQVTPLKVLPEPLLQWFEATFERDVRGEFPLPLLAALRWTRCRCGLEHARATCPVCVVAAGRAATIAQKVVGRVSAREIFATTGVIVAAALDGERLLWLEHRDGSFVREDGTTVCGGALEVALRFVLQPRATIVQRGEQAAVFGPPASTTMRTRELAANERHRYWIDGAMLLRDSAAGPETIGAVLGGQTRIWAGNRFGFGFYRASELTVGFVFDAEARGIRDDVALPRISGQLIDADAIFTGERCWLFVATQDAGQVRHRCTVIRRDGRIEASFDTTPTDGHWLARLHGNAAAGDFLLVATDAGLVRVGIDGGALQVTATFPDTAELVDASTRIFATRDGVYAVGRDRIRLLQLR